MKSTILVFCGLLACSSAFAKSLICEGNQNLMLFSIKNDIIPGDKKAANILLDNWLHKTRGDFGNFPVEVGGISMNSDKTNMGITLETHATQIDYDTLEVGKNSEYNNVISLGYNSQQQHAFLNFGHRYMNPVLGLTFPQKQVYYDGVILELPNCLEFGSTLALEPLQAAGGAAVTQKLYETVRTCRKSAAPDACFDRIAQVDSIESSLNGLYDRAGFVDQYGDVGPRNQQVLLVMSMYKKLVTHHSPDFVTMKKAWSAERVADEDDKLHKP